MTAGRSIDYDSLTQDALRGIVRAVLEQVAKTGLPGEHHFYIAFDTQAPGVTLSRRLKEKYPDEMMIVLQHRFWDLAVSDEGFEVKLTFDGIPERLVIPFQAMRVFFDPSVRFTLQFGDAGLQQEEGREPGTRRRRREAGAEADGGRRSSDLRTRSKTAARTEADGEGEEAAPLGQAAPQPAKPAGQIGPSPVASPRPVEAFPRPVPVPSAPAAPAAVSPAAPAKPAAQTPAEPAPTPQQGGAKVFSLDQFRKK